MLHLGKIPENYKEILLTNIKEFLDMVIWYEKWQLWWHYKYFKKLW
jgi:hypothetical protein